MTVSACSELPRSAPPPCPARVGQGTGAELPPWGLAGVCPISSLSLSGVRSRDGWSCGGWDQRCLPQGLLQDATWPGHRFPGKMQLVGRPGGSQPGNGRSRDAHKAPRRAGASPRPSAVLESATQWELSARPSPSLLAVPRSQVRSLPLFTFFKINHFWGEFRASEQCQPDRGRDYKGSVLCGRHPAWPKASRRHRGSLGC